MGDRHCDRNHRTAGSSLCGRFPVSCIPAGTQLLIGALPFLAVALLYHFFVFTVDYTRTEYVQYEDDDYVYYVKAVPKVAVTRTDVKVQRINNPVRGRHDRRTENYKERR